MLGSFQNGQGIGDLPNAGGGVDDYKIEVEDKTGESKQINLSEAVRTASSGICGRYWNMSNSTPVAAGYYGSLEMLRKLPGILGLGCYLVQDNRTRRKLDPTNHYFFEDGSQAKLDGTMGQYMWCWNAFHFATWLEGNSEYLAVSLTEIKGKKDYYIPSGGVSAIGGGVMDRTNNMLCSVVSDAAQYRGGNNNAALDGTYKSQLGMAATYMSATNFSARARSRGEGWDANWYVAQAVPEILFQIIFGTRHSQAAVNPALDANGLRQDGLGIGVTDFPNWSAFNGAYPVVPTSAGMELGDGCGETSCNVLAEDGSVYKTVKVPVFFGLKHMYGHLWKFVRGLVYNIGEEKSEVFVAPSLYVGYNDSSTDGLLKTGEMPRAAGYMKKKSWYLLNASPTETGGSASTYYCDNFWENSATSRGLRVRLAGANADNGAGAGAFATNSNNAASLTNVSVPIL